MTIITVERSFPQLPSDTPSRRRLCQMAIAGIVFGTWACPSASAADASKIAKRVALSGYDPVAYFTDGYPVEGSPAYSSEFNDTVYYFASAEHQKMFAAEPDRYAPHYSGYCALGVSMGIKVEGDPKSWVIFEDKLYVFGNPRAAKVFASDPAGTVQRAEANWAAVKSQELVMESTQ